MRKELVGWKEIADRLNVTVRAAQRYAAYECDPLPCYRRVRAVCLDTAQLEAWLDRHRAPLRPLATPATETMQVDVRVAPLLREIERAAVRIFTDIATSTVAGTKAER
jgi:hypothetical protein